ncbi:MAG: DUF975 family protein [Bacteroidales bacterium]|nr:DUF975 family protein [Bacteroidales bacterium]
MKTNQDYKNAALAALKGNWAPVIVATIIYFVITIIVSLMSELYDPETSAGAVAGVAILGWLVLSLFASIPLGVGYYNSLNLLLVEGDNQVTNNMFKIGYGNLLRNVGGMLLVGVFTFLWTLLLIIPGIIKSLAYSMTPFILKDYPELSANQAINLSMKMMEGRKFDLFYLYLSFIGWGILALFTLGIGYLWLMPYMYTSTAAFYQNVKEEYITNNNN